MTETEKMFAGKLYDSFCEGMPEARRTVVSNIHKGGIPAVEAGFWTS